MAIRKSRRSRLEENKRRIRKMKIDYNRYVKDFYLEDGIAVISCNVSDYYDIIDRYSVEGYEWLNEHFARSSRAMPSTFRWNIRSFWKSAA